MRLRSTNAVLLCVAVKSFAQDSPEKLCYYDEGKLAPAEIMPCFEGGPVSSCCMEGSNCLADNACWDPASGATYQYGCTDSSYQDDKCPKKCGYDTEASHWIGLVYCDGEGDTASSRTPNNTWLCHHPENCGGPKFCPKETVWPTTPTKMPPISCAQLLNPSATAFSDGNPLASIVVLPKDPDGVASYFSAHDVPTTSSSPITSVTSAASTTPKTSTPSTLATTTTGLTASPSSPFPVSSGSGPNIGPDPPNSGHSSALNIGLGAGIGIPVFFIITGLLSFYGWRKHKQAKHAKLSSPQDPLTPTTDTYPVGAAGSGFTRKAELDSTPINSPTMTTMGSGATDNGHGESVYEMESPETSPLAPVHRDFSWPPNGEIYEMEGDIPARPTRQELPSPQQPRRGID
ncbi:uncharacterized protein BDZ99DRAFT_568311 [Mytilinidion resinicola]|uniref:Mid2 domain-containing protein n=1 Tax=Mytilinidion resinicola TaxID=574789 RepID=A0A6A6YVT0_9PEZI|nr:uncharacterized protein BDZ99DRAFT_568311 [Mytilinidion resinicola]KAF2813052.1 hypothetical protein BDZ99DRAFT_568311 [Mytilinidion resinicola]